MVNSHKGTFKIRRSPSSVTIAIFNSKMQQIEECSKCIRIEWDYDRTKMHIALVTDWAIHCAMSEGLRYLDLFFELSVPNKNFMYGKILNAGITVEKITPPLPRCTTKFSAGHSHATLSGSIGSGSMHPTMRQNSDKVCGVLGDNSIIHGAIQFLTPENLTTIVSLVTSAIGVTTVAIKGIKLWVDERMSRKIKIRYKELEIEITGALSETQIQEKISLFSELHEKIEKDKVKIILD